MIPSPVSGTAMRPIGVGIDILSLDRAKRFLTAHSSKQIQKIFTESERKKMGRELFSPPHFAKLFAAKEAFFKAAGGSWMGLPGFSRIQIQPFAKHRFKAVSPRYQPKETTAEGCFFESPEWVGAQVILYHAESKSQKSKVKTTIQKLK